ncbi:tetratricopeptide repeat protein [Nostoc sp. C052]|uniref:AAA family ATPase n=1 Tax=Nostoc sp. C052 TaxID=2576902 RepID=UPI0015C3EECE|nr:AAA family ATPase [Nostoc sp. C052]QLE42080.1 tetratricopeptide repeat protein [Nostoc sp. C052]
MAAGLNNPYITGTPINNKEKFFGRDDLFRFIEDNLVQGTSVILLHGQRRIGKSSLLAQIPNFLSHLRQFVFIPLSLEGQSHGSLADILHHLATGIVRRLNLSEDQVKIPTKDALESDPTIFSVGFFIQLYQVLGDRKPVLLLDEFDTIGDRTDQTTTEDFFRHLQSMITNQPARFCLIPVVGRRLDDVKILVSLFRQAPRKEVSLLDETHTRQLITKPSEGILEYQPSAIEAIWQLCAGHPYFIQVLCSVLFEKARDKQEDRVQDWQKITEEDVKKNINEAIERADNGLAWFRQGLPIAERVVFAAIAEMQERFHPDPWKLLTDNGVVLTNELHEALETLKTGGFIQERELSELSRDRPYSHAVIVELVRRWFIRRHSLRTEILELDRLHPEVLPLYEQAKELHEQGDVIEAIALYEQVLQINPNHFQALLGMASACLEDEQFNQAVELYTRICKVDNLSLRYKEAFVKSLLGNGRDFMQTGNFVQAKTQFSTAIELEPENKRAQQRLSEVEGQLEQQQEQIRASLQTLRNPFFVGAPVPPEYFVGRRSVIAAAFDQIQNRSHLAIWGNTGVGKSSLLQFLASTEVWQQHGLHRTQAIIVTLNCADIVPFTPDAFWREIVSVIQNEISKNDPLHKDIEQILHSTSIVRNDDIRFILRKIGQQRKFLLLLLDDYDTALYPSENYTEDEMQSFLSDFRSLAVYSREQYNLSVIVTSKKTLNELSPPLNPNQTPWYNHYLFRQLRLFDEQEISELLGGMPEELKLTTELRQVIQEVSGGYPVLLQNACYLIYDFWRNGQNLTIENFTGEFLKAIEHIFQVWWLSCDEAEQSLLIFIAISRLQSRLRQRQYEFIDLELIISQNERKLANLEEMGLIKRTIQLGTTDYQFTSSMMEFWVLREIETSDEEKLIRWNQITLNLMSLPQADRIQFILRGLRHSKEASASVIDWLSKLAPSTSFGMR